jgi:hypothetical protein
LLGTFETPEPTVRAYDVMAWRYRRPKSELNFPDVTCREEAEFLAPEVRVVPRKEEKEDRLVVEQRTAHESDAVALARFAAANPHLVQAGYKFYARRDAQSKKKDETSPSRVNKIESDDEVEPDNVQSGEVLTDDI